MPGDVIDLQEKWCGGQNGSISYVNEIKVFFLVGRMYFYKQVSGSLSVIAIH